MSPFVSEVGLPNFQKLSAVSRLAVPVPHSRVYAWPTQRRFHAYMLKHRDGQVGDVLKSLNAEQERGRYDIYV